MGARTKLPKRAPPRALEAAMPLTEPPDSLTQTQTIVRLVASNGNRLFTVQTPESATLLVEIDERFRKTIWIKRGGYVVIETSPSPTRDPRAQGEIVSVCRNEKEWRTQPYWPAQFPQRPVPVDSDEEDSVVGKMPPSDSEEDD